MESGEETAGYLSFNIPPVIITSNGSGRAGQREGGEMERWRDEGQGDSGWPDITVLLNRLFTTVDY